MGYGETSQTKVTDARSKIVSDEDIALQVHIFRSAIRLGEKRTQIAYIFQITMNNIFLV